MILIKLVRETRLRENRSIHGDRIFPMRTLLFHLALYVDFSYTEVTHVHRFFSAKIRDDALNW